MTYGVTQCWQIFFISWISASNAHVFRRASTEGFLTTGCIKKNLAFGKIIGKSTLFNFTKIFLHILVGGVVVNVCPNFQTQGFMHEWARSNFAKPEKTALGEVEKMNLNRIKGHRQGGWALVLVPTKFQGYRINPLAVMLLSWTHGF